MSLKPYPTYKNSGVQWLGQIPVTWETVPLWAAFKRNKLLGTGSEVLLSVYRDHGVIPRSSRKDNFNKPSEDLSKYQIVEKGDLVINKMKAWQGSVAISEVFGIVSPAYFVFKPLHENSSRFMHYLMRSTPYFQHYASISSGVRPNQWDLDPDQHRLTPVLVPPLSEQHAIAEYLDRETAEIDAFIADQERLIELLEERRAATITHGVTKGIDPTVPMKETDLAWAPLIPQHWQISKISRSFRASKGQNAAELTQEYCASIPGPYPVYSGQTENAGVMALINAYEFDAGDSGALLTTTVGAKAMSVFHIQNKFSLSQNCMIISPIVTLATRYYYYQFQTLFEYEKGKIPQHMQASFRMNDLYQYQYLQPPSQEEQQIADYLDRETSEIDAAVSDAREAIALSRERRAALISAAVTGQVVVSQAQSGGSVGEVLEEGVRV